MRKTTLTLNLLLAGLLVTVSATAAAEERACSFAGSRPPLDSIRARALLCRADLTRFHLPGVDLSGADLTEANLSGANLTGANLNRANLTGANLSDADLTGAQLIEANLSRVSSQRGNLARAKLVGANLTGAWLFASSLAGADLGRADLYRADFHAVNLAETYFDPEPRSVGSVRYIEYATNMSRMTYRENPIGLVALREHFTKLGLRDREREVTFAKLKTQQTLAWRRGGFLGKVESLFSYVAFDLPCRYGLSYGRPLRILALTIPLMALIYAIALRGRGHGALWRVWQPDRIRKDQGQADPERLSWESTGPPRSVLLRLGRALRLGLLFSILSAFQIGWRELNVGNWITRLQPREYTLRATGWVRVISGVQSLVSVYLLALWVLTYFGRPFE